MQIDDTDVEISTILSFVPKHHEPGLRVFVSQSSTPVRVIFMLWNYILQSIPSP